MKPALYNATELAHSRFRRKLTFKADGAPVDLNGYTARMSVRKKTAALELVIDASDADGIALGGMAGTVEFDLDTSELAEGEYLYTLILYQGNAELGLLEGRLTLTPNMVQRVGPSP